MGGLFFVFGIFLIIRKKKNSCLGSSCGKTINNATCSPQRLTISYLDYVKMFFNWLFLFKKKPYTVIPGLYFTGDKYDKKTPLLVTCNFLSTVILLYRRIRPLNVRLIVVDTKGINVWCSSSGGRFSSQEIINKLNMYDRNILTDSQELEIIIPKLSLSGVKLSELRKNKIRPIIGPILAEDLKQYLNYPPYKDCVEDSVQFGIKSRLYTVVPTMIQFFWYAVLMGLVVFVFNTLFKTGFHWQIMPIVMAISFFYPILFPWLPGKRFAVKGISLAIAFSLYAIYLYMAKIILLPLMLFYVTFIFGTSIFLALSYTGNSSVSNYSKVKKEVIHFLPLSVVSYILTIVFYFVNGSLK
jgi:hypothetical protein